MDIGKAKVHMGMTLKKKLAVWSSIFSDFGVLNDVP